VQGRRGSVDLESTWLSGISGQQLAGLGIISQPGQQLPLQRQLLHLRLLSCTAEANGMHKSRLVSDLPKLVWLPSRNGPESAENGKVKMCMTHIRLVATSNASKHTGVVLALFVGIIFQNSANHVLETYRPMTTLPGTSLQHPHGLAVGGERLLSQLA
jgi:hypothetical protein